MSDEEENPIMIHGIKAYEQVQIRNNNYYDDDDDNVFINTIKSLYKDNHFEKNILLNKKIIFTDKLLPLALILGYEILDENYDISIEKIEKLNKFDIKIFDIIRYARFIQTFFFK